MTLAGLSYYLVSQFEEFGRLLITPATFFFENYPDLNQNVYGVVLGVAAILGFLNTFGVSRYLIDKLFAKQISEVSVRVRTIFAVVLTGFLAFIMSALALILAEFLTGQRLLFVLATAVMFPPAGFFFGGFAYATIALVPPVFWYGLVLIRFSQKARIYKSLILKSVAALFFFCSVAALTAMTTDMSWDEGGADAHHMHAVVKNTCLLDAQKVNCPQRLEDFAKVEPSFMQRILDRNQVFYSYNSQKNEYVLVVRYSPRKALLFSQLLKSPQQNGNQANDFQLLDVDTIGKDRIKEMPEFAKEFEYLPDWNKR